MASNINLDVSNSINGAYAAGRSEAFARQQEAARIAQQAKEEEDKAALLKEQQDEFLKKQSQEAEQFKAEHGLRESIFNLSQATAKQDMAQKGAEWTERTGTPAQGFVEDLSKSPNDTIEDPTQPGVFMPRATTYVNKDTGSSYTARSPQVAAAMSGQLAALAKEPLIKQDRATSTFENSLAEERQGLHDRGEWSHENDIKAVELAHDKAIKEEGYRNNLDVENLRGRYAQAIAEGKADAKSTEQLWLENRLDPVAQKAFGVHDGSTWHDVLGNGVMDAKGKEKFLTLSTMEPEAIAAEEALSARDSKGKTGFDRYFLGGVSGALKEQYQKLYPDPFVESIRPILSQLFLDAKDNAGVGSRLTAAQVQALKGITTGNERNITPERAEGIIKALLPAIREERVNIIKAYAKKGPQTSSSTTKATADDHVWKIVPTPPKVK